MKIIFFGSSEYCFPILSTLKVNFHLIAIITKTGTPIELFARKNDISVFTPKDKNELLNLTDKIVKLQPDIAVVADYGLIIPKVIFEIPKHQTLNIHFSKLPKLRGASPVQYTILTGKTAWISVIIMDEEMDTGDIVWQKEFDECKNETTESLYKKLFNNIAAELPRIINQYTSGKLKPRKQDNSQATYTKIFTRDDGFIPFELIIKAINGDNPTDEQFKKWPLYKSLHEFSILFDRAIRAFSPWPGVWTEIEVKQCDNETIKQLKKRLKILRAHIEERKLVLDLVQLEGKKPVSWKQFREGYPEIKLSNNS